MLSASVHPEQFRNSRQSTESHAVAQIQPLGGQGGGKPEPRARVAETAEYADRALAGRFRSSALLFA